MIKKEIGNKVLEVIKTLTSDCAEHRDDTGIKATDEQIEFFKLCREFNRKFYNMIVPTVVIPYKNGDIKYIGGVRGLHAHGKGQLYRKGNVPYIEGFFRCGMYLGP